MLVPVVILFVAIASAAGMAYGVDPRLVQFPGGLHLIMLARRLEWPLITVSLVMCLSVLSLVVSGKRRAWWLIGLAPVLALFLHRFGPAATQNHFAIAENPTFVAAEKSAAVVRPEDYVVGVEFNGEAYAYPYAALSVTPVVVQQDRDRRLMLMWSPYANVARAFVVTHELRPRELDIVGMPANGLLLYNARVGEFVDGITGRTQRGGRPTGFREAVPAQKMPWRQWLAMHPSSRLMLPASAVPANAPTTPVEASSPMPSSPVELPAEQRRVIVVPTSQPVAIPEQEIRPGVPLNVTVGNLPLLLVRDPATGRVNAFDRRLEEDLTVRFVLNRDRKRKDAYLIDSDTNTGWTADGLAVDADKKHRGRKLKPVDIDEGVDWRVMKFWLPNLQLLHPAKS
jgi:hypothetical protein